MRTVPARGRERNTQAAFASIYDGRRCVGHLISRGPKGFEAFDADDRSIGTFESQKAAAAAWCCREQHREHRRPAFER